MPRTLWKENWTGTIRLKICFVPNYTILVYTFSEHIPMFMLQAEAMQIVKTIGQAFDVCHQQQQQKDKAKPVTSSSENSPRRCEPTSLRLRPAEMPALLPSGHLTLPEELDLPAGLPSCSYAASSSPNRIIKSLSECNPSLVSHGLPGRFLMEVSQG